MHSLKNRSLIMPSNDDAQDFVTETIRKRFPKYSADDVRKFLNPRIMDLAPDPSNLHHVHEMADMVLSANKIGVFIDYDVDGVSSGAMWSIFLHAISIEHFVYFPARADGYGPSQSAIDYFRQCGCDLILFLDCGTTAADVIDHIHDIKTCVLDHHKPGNVIANTIIVNPYLHQQEEFYDICTAGLSFLVIAFIERRMIANSSGQSSYKRIAMQLLDLAALGTVADCMPLVGFNRACVKRGLEIIQQSPRSGIQALLHLTNKSNKINASTIGYYIASCLNAAGRLDTSRTAFDLLVATSYESSVEIAQALVNLNNIRKQIEADILILAEHQASAQNDNILVVRHEDWHPGVVGIVAGRLKEGHCKTTFAFYKKHGAWHGSARSSRHDLSTIIASGIKYGLIASGGGHRAAAGLCVNEDQFDEWSKWIVKVALEIDQAAVSSIICDDRALEIDHAMNAGESLPSISILAPFGQGNPNIRILIQGLILKRVTAHGEHLRLMFANHPGSYFAFRCANSWGRSLYNSIGQRLSVVLSVDDSPGGIIEDVIVI